MKRGKKDRQGKRDEYGRDKQNPSVARSDDPSDADGSSSIDTLFHHYYQESMSLPTIWFIHNNRHQLLLPCTFLSIHFYLFQFPDKHDLLCQQSKGLIQSPSIYINIDNTIVLFSSFLSHDQPPPGFFPPNHFIQKYIYQSKGLCFTVHTTTTTTRRNTHILWELRSKREFCAWKIVLTWVNVRAWYNGVIFLVNLISFSCI